MSYARFGSDSSVYVYRSTMHDAQLVCQACHLLGGGLYVARDTQAMIEHLQEHRDVGQLVPQSTFEQLIEERDAG